MTSGAVERRTATMQARLAQGGLVIALAAAGALGVLGLPGAHVDTAPTALEVPEPPSKSPEITTTRHTREIDERQMASAAAMLENSPKTAAPTKPDGEPPKPAPPPPAETKYIGLLDLGGRGIAILVDGGRQRVVRAGDTIADGSRVITIAADAIEVESGGQRRSIPMAEGTGERIGRASASAIRVAPIPAAATKNNAPALPRGDAKTISLGSRPSAKRVPNTPDGSPERLEELIRQMRESGRFESEEDAAAAAKELFEAETLKYGEKGGPQ